MADAAPLLEVSGLTKTFRVAKGPSGDGSSSGRLRALDSVGLTLGRGETLGLVGESGCGKSTLARTLLRLEQPDEGRIRFDGVDPFRLKGKELLAWRRRIQMVFQDPFASLNARMTAAEIIAEPWSVHRDLYPTARQRAARAAELLEMVGLRGSDADRCPQEFSGGQRQRIGIARALALDPDVIVCDEPVSALDLSVQAQVVNLLGELQRQLSVSYLFISHDLSVVRHIADRVAVMYLGRIIETGSTEDVLDRPRHPYTAALTAAAPVLDVTRSGGATRAARPVLKGEIPSPTNPPSGCHFRTRCERAEDLCAQRTPAREPVGEPGGRADGGPHAGTDDGAGTAGAACTADAAAGSAGAAAHTAACHFPLDGGTPPRSAGRTPTRTEPGGGPEDGTAEGAQLTVNP
ncbi:ABC transporter ATP-binding protein [Streptomyces bathyalis]|uniref:ABC transporter ATP-binding protein n=1 Tax=Streptomyces bathyalis TaxID=2710756 RepID=A0A7T1T7C2_9ACTN|nr:ABC transporter ATP-binding protein [Streptomyces bathyalis]QPP07744.1 ABC transporter ATP-binding protein [Streptomyces bathyalis]